MSLLFGSFPSALNYDTTTMGRFAPAVELVSQQFFSFNFICKHLNLPHLLPFPPLVFVLILFFSSSSLLQSPLWRS